MLTSLIKIIINQIQIYNEYIKVDYHDKFLFILSTESNEFFANKFYLYKNTFTTIKYDYLQHLSIYFPYYYNERF
jgi:hypothetical protein